MGYRFSLPAGWPNVQNVPSLSLFLSSTTNSSFGNITSQISLFSLIPTPSVYAQLCSYGYPATDYTYNGAKRGQNLAICSKICLGSFHTEKWSISRKWWTWYAHVNGYPDLLKGTTPRVDTQKKGRWESKLWRESRKRLRELGKRTWTKIRRGSILIKEEFSHFKQKGCHSYTCEARGFSQIKKLFSSISFFPSEMKKEEMEKN